MFFSIDGGDAPASQRKLNASANGSAKRAIRSSRVAIRAARRWEKPSASLLLKRLDMNICRTSEMFLYMAARAQLADEVIRPALAADTVVVADRYLLANVVYQGHAGGLDVPTLWQIGQIATGGLMPDLTIVLDLPAAVAAQRLGRDLDRMELQGDEFHARVREGFLAEAAASRTDRGDRRRAADRPRAGRSAACGPAGSA